MNVNIYSQIFQRELTESKVNHKCLLVIQCDSGHKNANLIACARYRIYDELVKPLEKRKTRQCITHTLFVIYLPPQVSDSMFVGFQGDPWISSHIDELMPTSIAPQDAAMTSISKIFIGEYLNYINPLLGEAVVGDENQSFEASSSISSDDHMIDNRQEEKNDIEPEDQEFEAHELTSSSDSWHQSSSVIELQQESSPNESGIYTIPIPQTSETRVHSNKTEEVLIMDVEDISDNERETTSDQSDEGSSIQRLNSSDSNPILEQKNLLAGKSTEVLEVGAVYPDDLTDIHSNQNEQIQVDETLRSREEGNEVEMTSNGSKQHIASHTVSIPTEFIAPLSLISDVSVKPKILPLQHPTAQCKRLYGSIQSAVSKTEDLNNDRSMDRVKRLIKLIPKHPEELLSKLMINNYTMLYLSAFFYFQDPSVFIGS